MIFYYSVSQSLYINYKSHVKPVSVEAIILLGVEATVVV